MKKRKEYTLLIEKDETGLYIGEIVELPGCHTQGKDIPELLERIKEAIDLYLDDKEIYEPLIEFIGTQKVFV